jgi:predicted small lipoprotein YifL
VIVSRGPRLIPVALAAALAAGVAGCGKKGPPLAPLRLEPARVADLTVHREADRVRVQFAIPSANTNGSTPADLSAVEVLALTLPPNLPGGRAPDDVTFLAAATRLATIEVEPPPPPGAEPSAAAPADPRPAQGERVTVEDRLTGPALQPVDLPAIGPVPRGVPEAVAPPGGIAPGEPGEIGEVVPPISSPVVRAADPVRRYYAVRSLNRRGRPGPLSARVALPLTPAPPVPPQPAVRYDDRSLEVTWDAPAGARQPSIGPAAEGGLAATPLVREPPPHTYNVYAVEPEGAGSGAAVAVPLNPAPLDVRAWTITPVPFGQARCFAVRSVEAGAGVTVESEASSPACVTPADTFPPAAPTSLAAVGSEGAINLIWEPIDDADLAGYLVLRGEGDAPLVPLTPDPVRETTYRDTAVRAGVRYVYAVVAVDDARPRNASAQSNRVEETAR